MHSFISGSLKSGIVTAADSLGYDTSISTVLCTVERNRKSYACVLSGLCVFGAKQMQARECLLLIKILQEGHEEERE